MQTGNTQTKKKGFTLIELLVVIAIIGLLSTIGLGLLRGGLLGKGRDAQRMSDIRQIALAMETAYNSATNKYPSISPSGTTGRLLVPTSIGGVALPTDPGGGANTTCTTSGEMTAAGYCVIANTTDLDKYCIYANLAASDWFVASKSGVRHVTAAPTTLAICNP
ncbi:MAG: type II secretion system protein [bacterium]|nr:type II secretion system protein [bacterium]